MQAWTDAKSPALAIVARGDQIQTVAPAEYVVRSQSRPEVSYKVTVLRERWACECPFFSETKQSCVHILAVRFREGFKAGPVVAPPTNPGCERCHSGDVILSGKRRNKSGVVGRFLCKTCGFRFTGRDGFQRRRADPEKIALALDLYFRGMSVRKVGDHLAQVYGLRVSAATVYNWIAHFSKVAAEWMDRQGAAVGEKWHVDETVVSINGQRSYVWNVLDAETRFLLATHVSRDRGMADTRAPLHKAKEVADGRPTEVFTDGMKAYPAAVYKEFGTMGRHSPHHRVPSIRAPESNNLVERLHGTEKERIKVMRGFDNPNGTSALMEGFRVHYNLVRDHSHLGKTPGEAAGIAPIGGFRWSEILRLASLPEPAGTELRLVGVTPENGGDESV
jgi:putative transposase